MSVSKWRYSEACEGKPCIGECDLCKEYEVEQDGWVTWNEISDTQEDVYSVQKDDAVSSIDS